MWIRPERKPFEGNWVMLENVNQELHCIDLYEMAVNSNNQEGDIFQYMPYGPFTSMDDFKEWMQKQESMSDRIVFSVFSKRIGKYVGICSIINIDEKNGRAELGGIWYGKVAQKTEINTETCYILLKYLFEELHYRRIEWKCDNDNFMSKKAATRLGFKYEGLFRKHMIVKGKNRDTAWYSMIDDEWDNVKNHFNINLLREYRK